MFAIWNVVKLVGEWQLSQAALPTGTWFAGSTLNAGGAMFAKLLPAPWQTEQVLTTTEWSMVKAEKSAAFAWHVVQVDDAPFGSGM